jgi:hypothetical protein
VWGAAFISLSFFSNHLHSPPSFISKWFQEVFPWYYNSQRIYQTTCLQLLFGSRVRGQIYTHVISVLFLCGDYAQRIILRTSHAQHSTDSKSPLVNVRLHKTPVISKVIRVTTSKMHMNRLDRHLQGIKETQ